MDLGAVLTAEPEEIQEWLNARRPAAPSEVRAVILAVDYVEPGSLRRPDCDHYLMIGEYEGERERIEIAFQVKAGAPTDALALVKLL
jgi:hypothetical protein